MARPGGVLHSTAVLAVVVLGLVALAGLGAGVAGASSTAEEATYNDTPVGPLDGSVQTTDDGPVTLQTSDELDEEIPEEIREALPDIIFEEIPEELLLGLLGELPEDLADDIEEELELLDEIPDGILENLIEDMLDSIPEEFLEDPPDDLIEDPPDEIPAVLCRAQDMAGKEDPSTREEWGPTDVNAQLGNHNLTVATNELGSVTVFKYPSPSYASHVKHHAMDRQKPYYGADNNSGAFLGLVVTTDDGTTDLEWLRDWGGVSTVDPDYADHVDQHWDASFSDTLHTEYRNNDLGLDVSVTDAVPLETDAFVRDVAISADEDSPVTDVEVVSYANFNLVDNTDAAIPTQDWCDESQNDADVHYDDGSDAIVYETPEFETVLPDEMLQGAGPEFSVATAMGFDGESSQYQIAGDDYMTDSPDDPYRLLSNGTVDLPGQDEHSGQVSTAMTRDVDFTDGTGQARIYLSAASEDEPELALGEEAVATLDHARELALEEEIDTKEEYYRSLVGDAPMPEGAPENVTELSKRALVTLVQLWDPHTTNEHGYSGSIMAAAPTQAPYGADWIRDGSYFNYALDRYVGQNASGKHDWVDQHNRWYMSLQQNPGGPCPEHCHENMQYYDLGLGIVPDSTLLRTIAADELPFLSAVHDGEWAMNYYADGVPAGPLGGQIDQTAYGAHTLWDHYAVSGNETYLERIYPAIRLAADRMTDESECVDGETNLQCPRPEDDNPEFTQTIRGGASAYMGLDAAAKAAGELYDITGNESYAEDAYAYAYRRDELSIAMDEHYWNDTGGGVYDSGFYGERRGSPSPRVAMSSFMRPVDHPRMQSHLENMWATINRTFSGEVDQGQYETKELIGLGVAARESDDPPVSLDELETGVEWLATEAARSDSTHVMGEAWLRQTYADDSVDAAVSQPHTWQQLLTYMSALVVYGNESIDEVDLVGHESYTEWRRHDGTVTAVEIDDQVATNQSAEATATVRNDAPVEQRYHVTLELEGPEGAVYTVAETDIGPLGPDETQTVSLGWEAEAVPTGTFDATVSVWKATAGDGGTVTPEAIAAEPTGLAAAELRHVELDTTTESDAVLVGSAAQFTVDTLDPATVTVTAGDVFDLSVTVANGGGVRSTATVLARNDGDDIGSDAVELDAGDETTVTLDGLDSHDLSAGEYDLTVVILHDGVEHDAVTGEMTVTAVDEDQTGDADDGADDDGPGFGLSLAIVSGAIACLYVFRRKSRST